MINGQRANFFPRGINEASDEVAYRRIDLSNLMIQPDVALHYPFAVYFFTNKTNKSLAERIEKGLTRAIADGSFDKLFFAHHHDLITNADLQHKTIIELNNPILPKETPLKNSVFWFDPKNI